MAQEYAKDQPAGYTNRIERVAIVGASGSIGRYIALALLRTGKHTLTALSRGGASNSAIPPGIDIAEIDYSNPATITEALSTRNIQALIITLSVHAPPTTHSTLVAAAAAAGCVKYILPNCYCWIIPDSNETLLRESLAGEQVLAYCRDIESHSDKDGKGPYWIAPACSFWYVYSLAGGYAQQPMDLFGFDFANRKITFFVDSDGDNKNRKINVSTAEQCGRAVAALLSLKELPEDETDKESITISRWRNKPLRISSFYVSQRDMLDAVHQVLGTTDEDWTMETEDLRERYEKGVADMKKGDPTRSGFARALYARIFFPDAGRPEDGYASAEGADNEVLGLPKESLVEATREAVELVMGGGENKKA